MSLDSVWVFRRPGVLTACTLKEPRLTKTYQKNLPPGMLVDIPARLLARTLPSDHQEARSDLSPAVHAGSTVRQGLDAVLPVMLLPSQSERSRASIESPLPCSAEEFRI